MKIWMRIVAPVTAMTIAVSAQAQQWTAGMYGGMQACPYEYAGAESASSYDDVIKEKQDEIKEWQSQLRTKENERKRAERNKERSRKKIENAIDEAYTSDIFAHIDDSRTCDAYKGFPVNVIAEGVEGSQVIGKAEGVELNGFPMKKWFDYCDKSKKGNVLGKVCEDSEISNKEKNRTNSAECKKSLTEYRTSQNAAVKLQTEVEDLKAYIEAAKDEIKVAKEDKKFEERERRREMSETEGDYCPDCAARGSGYAYRKPETNWGSVIGNVGLGALAIGLGYSANKHAINAAADLGYPSNPYPAWGYGFPFIATGLSQAIGGGGGIYGAIGGGIGAGAFGCAGMNGGPYGMMSPYGAMNGNGMWGNPYASAMMNPFASSGAFLPGMGPWGINGAYNNPLMAMMNPMMSMNPMLGINGGLNMNMNPFMNPMMGINPMMGLNGGMGFNPLSAMMGMNPMMNPMMGMNGMMGMDPMGSMQMQQQMMQMQQQQYQFYMQQQQSYMQQQMQRQQVVAGLQQELYSLLSRIQQVQYGGGLSIGGSLGIGSGYYGYGSSQIGLGSGITPLPGSSGVGIGVGIGTGTSPIPVPR
ncbi:MAG: hypothetical protein AAGB31_16575 [Bdellovibrio sp.]